MALTPEQRKKLPPSILALLESQDQGDQGLPSQQDPSGSVLPSLQGALGRRFGEGAEFDPEYDAELRGLVGQIPQLQSTYATRRQRMGEDFTLAAEQLDRQNEMARDRHLNSMADRGLGYSGANLVGQGRIGEQFQRSVQGANTAYARGLTDTAFDEANAYQNILAREATAQGTAAERARVRDETRKWQNNQQDIERQRLAQESDLANQEMERQQQQQAQYEQQLRNLEAQVLAASQPVPTETGTYAPPGPEVSSPVYNPVAKLTKKYNKKAFG